LAAVFLAAQQNNSINPLLLCLMNFFFTFLYGIFNGFDMSDKALDYSKLMLRLVKDFTWPSEYMFKFVVPFDAELLNEVKLLFDAGAKITHKESKNGNYISVTAVQIMDNPDAVIAVYKNAENIRSIIAL
jgi:putative lipoic acid-binding regulatory protein